MIKLAPSILSANFAALGADIAAIEKAGTHYVHIDVMDGVFVPNITFGIPVVKCIRPLTDMIFDVHLMIVEPERHIEAFARAGADIINVHAEACADLKNTVSAIKSLGKKAAATVKPKTDIECIYDILPELDMVLIMSVEPGFGGQTLIPETLLKAHRLADYAAKNGLCFDIEMDGGITPDNVREVLNAGVNVIVAGSSVFGTPDIERAAVNFYNIFSDTRAQNIEL